MSNTWKAEAPKVQENLDVVSVMVRAIHIGACTTTDYHEADAKARALVKGAKLFATGVGADGIAARLYHGTDIRNP